MEVYNPLENTNDILKKYLDAKSEFETMINDY